MRKRWEGSEDWISGSSSDESCSSSQSSDTAMKTGLGIYDEKIVKQISRKARTFVANDFVDRRQPGVRSKNTKKV
jgi:hypothetical protein